MYPPYFHTVIISVFIIYWIFFTQSVPSALEALRKDIETGKIKGVTTVSISDQLFVSFKKLADLAGMHDASPEYILNNTQEVIEKLREVVKPENKTIMNDELKQLKADRAKIQEGTDKEIESMDSIINREKLVTGNNYGELEALEEKIASLEELLRTGDIAVRFYDEVDKFRAIGVSVGTPTGIKTTNQMEHPLTGGQELVNIYTLNDYAYTLKSRNDYSVDNSKADFSVENSNYNANDISDQLLTRMSTVEEQLKKEKDLSKIRKSRMGKTAEDIHATPKQVEDASYPGKVFVGEDLREEKVPGEIILFGTGLSVPDFERKYTVPLQNKGVSIDAVNIILRKAKELGEKLQQPGEKILDGIIAEIDQTWQRSDGDINTLLTEFEKQWLQKE